MAMNGDVLGKAIAGVVNGFDLTTDPPPSVEDMWIAIAAEIVKHIQTTATVSTTVSTTVNTVVQTVPTTGTGKGTGSGTGSGSGAIT